MSDSNIKDVLVIVPVYNAAPHLPELIRRCREVVTPEKLLFVNDGSTDGGLEILKKENVNYISYPVNRGKGAALKAGFEYAIERGYRSVLTIDADLQHLPEEMRGFFEADDGRTVLIGTRKMGLDNMPFARLLSNNLTSLIISVFSSRRVRDSQSGFRLMPTSVLKAVQLKTVKYDFESEMLFKMGALDCPIGEVPISTIYEDSQSYINPLKDTLRFIRQIWKRIWA
jgi:glycosyltransferase involved in cell wall biosynthesis